jgi:hypothetical protein
VRGTYFTDDIKEEKDVLKRVAVHPNIFAKGPSLCQYFSVTKQRKSDLLFI